MKISEKKKRILDSIKRKPLDRLPLMYRALPSVTDRLLSYFSLNPDINSSWQDLIDRLEAESYSSGSGLGKFTTYKPAYKAQKKINKSDSNMFYAWGIDSYYDAISNSLSYVDNASTAGIYSVEGFKKLKKPDLSDFDIKLMTTDQLLRREHMLGAGVLNSIFMIAMYLRSANNLFMELVSDKKFAHFYIDMIGELSYELNKAVLEKIGNEIDFYKQWDDIAMQSNMMIPHDIFKEFFYPWYKKLFSEAKKYGLVTVFHICGNANDIIPDLIELGVDVLDPVQTSAKDMDLASLKKKYGKYISFHGGVDVQGFLQNSTPRKIKDYAAEAGEMFKNSGGLILGPSHEITPDTRIENIIALYRPDLLKL